MINIILIYNYSELINEHNPSLMSKKSLFSKEYNYYNYNDEYLNNYLEHTELINNVEKLIQMKHNDIKKEKHEKFINKANKYDNNQSQKELFRHLKQNSFDDIIFNYNGNKLFDDDEIMEGLEDYTQNLYGKRSRIYGKSEYEVEKIIESIINKSFEDDNNDENKPFTYSELNNALKDFSNSKSIGLDFISYKLFKITLRVELS